ncbi:MAG: integrase core domain-containing protein [Kiritimatiellia bacterium]|jgi:transposase InsO family protein|nr:integrase core domain-containing protein [Kiritimatiellia bacterium]
MQWKRMLACVTGEIEESLLARIEYLIEENRVLRNQLDKRLKLTDPERKILAEKAVLLGKLMAGTVTIVKPESILKWHRKLIAKKFDGSRNRKKHGRPPVTPEIESLVLAMARENPSWGYDRIAGAMENLGHRISDQTVGNILKRNGIAPSDDRKKNTTWSSFIRQHKEVLWATDFFTAEIWTKTGLTTFYVLFFIHVKTRRVAIGGLTEAPNEQWMKQVLRNVTGYDSEMPGARYLIHDRDSKFSRGFDDLLVASGIQPVRLPPKSPNLNAYAERFVRSIKDECLDRMILFGERSLRYVIKEYAAHYHAERNHQGIGNMIPFPDERLKGTGKALKSERLGGLLNFYHREAA